MADDSPAEKVLHEGERTRVIRVDDPDHSGQTLIRRCFLGPRGAFRLRREERALHRIEGLPGVPRLHTVIAEENAVLYRDDHGTPLADSIRDGGGNPAEAARLGAELARILAGVHRVGVIHRDVNPGNVLIPREGNSPVLIDFDLSLMAGEDTVEDAGIAGTPAYLAPEQTGRTGRPIDHRVDLYGLGATVYTVLNGAPPFDENTADLLALVHAQMSKEAPPLASVRPDVPTQLSDIIARLMSKDPDERYQSAQGAAHDLSRVADQLELGSTPTPFPLGDHDFPPRIPPPATFVGRQGARQVLRNALDDAMGERGGRLLVSGAPGVGKSALLLQLRPMITSANGWFVRGTFDRNRSGPDADAVAHVLRRLALLLLSEPEQLLAEHRRRLHASLGSLARSLAQFPELRTLLDVEPEPSAVDPTEAISRWQQAALTFLRTLASPERPIAVVLDDLHWAGVSPLSILDDLLTVSPTPGLLVVGAYRDGDLDGTRPPAAMIDRWVGTEGVPTLTLDTLGDGDVAEFLAAMLRLPPPRARQLADAIATQSHGNASDTVELVNGLRQDDLLRLTQDGWVWDAEAISTYVGARSVIDLIHRRIDALAQPTRDLLHIFALLGDQTGLDLLGVAADMQEKTLRALLEPALRDRLVLVVDGDEVTSGETVRFRHDRVQQAARSGNTAHDDRRLHLTLARRLAAHPGYESAAAEQYLGAQEFLREPLERRQAAELFLGAADRIHLADAAVAEKYLLAASDIESALGIPDRDPLAVATLRLRHAVLYTQGRMEESEALYRRIIALGDDAGSHLDSDCIHLSSLTNRRQYAEAIALGIRLLCDVGMPPPPPSRMIRDVGEGLAEMQRWVTSDDSSDERREPLTDPDLVVAAQVLNRMGSAALLSGDQIVVAWLVVRAFRIWNDHGPHPYLIGPIASCGAVAVQVLNDYRLGYQVMRRVLPFAERSGFEPGTSQAKFLFGLFSNIWVRPVETTTELYHQAREGCLRGGDPHYASFAAMYAAAATLQFTPSVEAYLLALSEARSFITRAGNSASLVHLPAFEQFGRALQGRTLSPGSFDDGEFSEEAYEQLLTAEAAKVNYHNYRALSALVFDDLDALIPHAALALTASTGAPATYSTFLAQFLHGFSLATQIRTGSSSLPPASLLAELDDCRSWLNARAGDSPANFAALSRLLDAERARSVGDVLVAASGYDEALELVNQRFRPLSQALIREKAAVFYLDQGWYYVGRALLAEAHHSYSSWGADGKTRHLEQHYPFLRSETGPQVPIRPERSGSRSRDTDVPGSSSRSIDLMAVLAVTRKLSTETDLDRLREQVTEVLAMMTGAGQVQLALWNDDQQDWLFPSPRGHTGSGLINAQAAAKDGLLPLTALRFAERTREPLIVDDAINDDRFSQDPYIQGLSHCSLLVIPILARGTPRAMLVLENHLISGAFSRDLVDLTLMIAGQLALALDNALAERFRSLVQRSTDLTLVCDPRGKIDYASAASTGLLGQTRSRIIGTTVTDLFHEEDRDELREWLASSCDRQEALVLRKARSSSRSPRSTDDRWIEVTGTNLQDDPAVNGLMLRLRDVTDRRRLEIELHQAQRLESVGRLAAGVAHELNTPIQFIQDNVAFLQEAFNDLRDAMLTVQEAVDTGDGLTELLEEIPQALSETLEGAERMSSIVQAMKTFRNTDGGSFAATDLNTAVRHTVALASEKFRDVARIDLHLDPELPDVMCRTVEINQALLNIIINAAQAMTDAKQHTGETGVLTIRTHSEGGEAVIEIEDTGVGIAPEIADLVYDQFFTTRPVGSGTGQGLFLAHTVIHDHHNGSVTFSSALGEGTTFTIRLPRFQESAQPDTEIPRPRTQGQPAGSADASSTPSPG
jgi:PAS domain S-box-containing protein